MIKNISSLFIAMSLATPTAAAPSTPKQTVVVDLLIAITNVSFQKPGAQASVARDGVKWLFNGSGYDERVGATLDGVSVAPASLKIGINCLLDCARTGALTGLITKISCKTK